MRRYVITILFILSAQAAWADKIPEGKFSMYPPTETIRLKQWVPTWRWECVVRDLEYISADIDTDEPTRIQANKIITSIRTLLQERALDEKAHSAQDLKDAQDRESQSLRYK